MRNLKDPLNLKGSVSSSGVELETDRSYLIGLGTRIREVRGKTTQEEFAPAYGLHVNTLRRYELGERSPDPGFLRELVRRNKKVDPAWLLMAADDARVPLHAAQDSPPYNFAGAAVTVKSPAKIVRDLADQIGVGDADSLMMLVELMARGDINEIGARRVLEHLKSTLKGG